MKITYTFRINHHLQFTALSPCVCVCVCVFVCVCMHSDYKKYHTDMTVRFVMTLSQQKMEEAATVGFYKKFKLESYLSAPPTWYVSGLPWPDTYQCSEYSLF